MKVIEADREKVIKILNIALENETGSSIYIPCASKKEQQDFHTCLVRELKVLSEISAEDAASLTHRVTFKDGRFWVVLTRIDPVLTSVYIKSPSGHLIKHQL